MMRAPRNEVRFNSHLKNLAAAGACLLLLACAGTGPAQPPLAHASALTGISPDGYYALARLQHAARRSSAAMASYRKALDADPRHTDASNGMATLLAEQGDLPAAIGLWQQLTAGKDAGAEYAYLFRNLGNAYLASGQLPLAESALEKACALDPVNASGWKYLGRVYERQGRSEQAARMFRQADALLAGKEAGAAASAAASLSAASPPAPSGSAGLARLELVHMGTGMVELRRLPPQASTTAAVEAAQPDARMKSQPVRPTLEISNGNGVAGMATALGRMLKVAGWQVTRVANERHFQVGRTRIEHSPQLAAQARELAQQLGPQVLTVQADAGVPSLRIVLGRDLSDVAALRQRYLQLVKLSKDNVGNKVDTAI